MWYFAYASNMSRRQMETRLDRVGLRWTTGWVSDYTLRFNKEGQDRSGKANIVPCQGEKVWGVLYEISEEEFTRLVPFEPGYKRTALEVTIPSWDQTCVAQAFLADATTPERLPTSAYLQLILQGAEEHGLPHDYCHTLRQVKTTER